MVKRKRTTPKKTARKTRKTTTRKTKKKPSRKVKTISKKYSSKGYKSLGRRTPSTPRSKKANNSRSIQPHWSTRSSVVPVEYGDAKREYKQKQMTITQQDSGRKRKFERLRNTANKVQKGTHKMIEWTAKEADKVGSWSEKAAPSLTAMAAANPENPFIGMAAGAVDSMAVAHATYKAILGDHEAYKKLEDRGKSMPERPRAQDTSGYLALKNHQEDMSQALVTLDTQPTTMTKTSQPYEGARYVRWEDRINAPDVD